jgi:hypothetical protein
MDVSSGRRSYQVGGPRGEPSTQATTQAEPRAQRAADRRERGE